MTVAILIVVLVNTVLLLSALSMIATTHTNVIKLAEAGKLALEAVQEAAQSTPKPTGRAVIPRLLCQSCEAIRPHEVVGTNPQAFACRACGEVRT